MEQRSIGRPGHRGRPAAAGTLLRLLALILLPTPGYPAHPVFDARGFDPEREFLSELPYEHVDPMTGNLLLTFTDLVLPGNAGFDLRVQRTYNSKVYENYTSGGPTGFREDSWAGIGWSLHFGRVSTFPGLPTLPGPVIEMPDGSQHQAYRHKDGIWGHYITRDYWTYEDRDPAPPVLRLPSGLVYVFDRREGGPRPGEVTHYVTQIRDPFGNSITVNYAAPPAPADVIANVVQRVGTRTRTVTFAYDPTLEGTATGSLRSMSFDGRTWTYRQKRTRFFGYSALTEVRPPVGPSWRFEYSESPTDNISPWLLTRLFTPSNGRIEYAYTAQLFRLGSGVVYTPSLQARTASGPGIATGTWRYEYRSTDWRDPIQSTVLSPCGTTFRYSFKPIGAYGAEEPWAIGSMASKETLQGSLLLERQVLTWTRSAPISDFPESGSSFATHVPLLAERTVTRAGSSTSYRTRHFYSPLPYSRARASNFNDHGRPFLTLETGELDRATVRDFAYLSRGDPSFGTYIVDRTASEILLSGTGVFRQSFEYDSGTGFRTSEDVYGIVTRFTPDAYGNVATARDANNNVTRFTYDWGVVRNTTTPEYTVTREINTDGSVRAETRRGLTTRFQYDALGRPTLVRPPTGLETRTEYDNLAGAFARVSRGSSAVTTRVNGFEQVVGTENSVHLATTRRYDICGRPVYEGYPFYKGGGGSPSVDTGTTTTFDGLGRVVRRTHPDGAFQAFEHRGIDVTITDENGRRTVQDWSAHGSPGDARLVALTDADGKTSEYSYNALGRLTRVEGPGSAPARRFVYNARNELVLETHPEAGTVRYTYDPAGNLQGRRDEEFGLTSFAYDGNRRLVSIDRPGSAHDTTFAWDESDNRKRVANGHVDSRFQYDALNRLIQRADAVGARSFVTTYAYDDSLAGNGNLKTLGYPSGRTVTYDYDSEGRITAVRGAGRTLADAFRYHASGGVASFRRGNGIVETLAYDARYRPVEIDSGNVLDLRYGYDAVGNVRSVDDRRPGMDASFTYDSLDRLLTAKGPWGLARYGYDVVGNRLSRSVGASSTTYSYDAATQRLTVATGSDADRFTYDRNGNLREDSRGTFAYAPTNLLETASVSSQVSTYRYDGDELRTIGTTGGEKRYYVHGPGGSLLSEHLEKGAFVEPVRDYVYAGSRLIAAIKPSPLAVTPTGLGFTALAGGPSTPGRKVKIETSGTTGIAFTAVPSAPWITVSATSGATPYNLTVAVNPASLGAGTHAGTVTIAAPLAQGSPKIVSVSAAVVGQPELQVIPDSLSFEATAPTTTAAMAPAATAAASSPTADAFLAAPLVFEPNRGQADASVAYLARGPGYGLFLAPDSLVVGLAPSSGGAESIRLRFVDANARPVLTASDGRPGRSHYYRGSDPKGWRTDIPQFGRVTYEELYPGIDAVFYGNQRQLEYDLVVAPGADPGLVRLSFEGARGIRLNDEGDLVVEVGDGELVQRKPLVYQRTADGRVTIPGSYRVTGETTAAFALGEYDREEPLVIDPVLSYFTYLGGSVSEDESCVRFERCGQEWLTDVAVDGSGSVYVVGLTVSTDLPRAGAGEETGAAGQQDLFVARLDPLASSLVFSTYLGGSLNEYGGHVALGPGGSVFVAGGTRSTDFPTTDDAPQRFFAGPFDLDPDGQDVVVAKLGADGGLVFSTYFGGSGQEWAEGIGVDAAGRARVGGATGSDDLPVRSALQPARAGAGDAFVAAFAPSGKAGASSLVWATYLGGSGGDWVNAFTTDAAGNSYIVGWTQSADFPTVAALQDALNLGAPVPSPPQYPLADAFVTKVDPSGASIVFSTYLGGTEDDWGTGVALGPNDTIFVTGNTASTDYPLFRPLQPYLRGGVDSGYGIPYDGFATVLLPGTSTLLYSTFLGAPHPRSPAVDSSGSLFFLHWSDDGLSVHPFASGGGSSLARIEPDGSAYVFASPVRSGVGVGAQAMTLDSRGNVFLVGSTATPDLATPGVFQTGLKGWTDGFVMKLTGTGGAGGGSSFLQQALLIKDRVLETGPSWTASESLPWLELSRTSGTGPNFVLADVDTTGLVPGVYEGAITVTAAGALGSPKQVPVRLTITPTVSQPAQADAGGPYFGQLFSPVELDGSASVDPAGSIAFYRWTFDDSATAFGPSVRRSFETPGDHPVTLTIGGFSGATATATTNVHVNYPAEVRPGGPYAAVVDEAVLFDATASFDPDGTIVSYQWSFGDGATGVGPVFPHRYSQPGTYTVWLSVQDDTGYWSAAATTAAVTAAPNEPPVARPGGPYLGEPGASVSLDGRASTDGDGSIVAWEWDFGDGENGTGAVALHAYASEGQYDVTLTVTDDRGGQGTGTTRATVGRFSVTPSDLRFRMLAAGDDPSAQAVDLEFSAPIALAWTATVSEPWLSLDVAAGTTPATIRVSVDGSGLDPGTRQGAVTVTPAGAGARPLAVPVELVVEPPAGTCEATAWYCEPFDELGLGDLAGQNGWEATPEATTANLVVADPRPGPGAKILRLDPAPGLVGIERVNFAAHPLDDVEMTLEVMSEGVEPGSTTASLDLLGEPGADGWGVETRAFGSLWIGDSLVFRYDTFTTETLVESVEPGRWYAIRLVYREGEVEGWVDGQRQFTVPMNDAAFEIAGLAVTGGDGAGSVSIDLLQVKPYMLPPLDGELVVEPGELSFDFDADSGTVTRAEPNASTVLMASSGSSVPPAHAVRPASSLNLPLEFEANIGQADPSVRFLARGRGYGLFVTPTETVLALPAQGTPIRVRFEGARRDTELRGLQERPGKSHYLLGSDPRRWRRNVPRYARVEARGIYPGVSAVFYGNEGRLEYDLELAPGVDPGLVRLAFEGVESLRVDERGDLVLVTEHGELRHQRPVVYQAVGSERRAVEARYLLAGANRASFEVGPYDNTLPLTIDPTLVYATFLGGTYDDGAQTVAIDLAGHAYVGGYTASVDFPITDGSYQNIPGGNSDAFVTKLDLAGTGVVYSTYIGGVSADSIDALAVDPEGAVYAGGQTQSVDFPRMNAYQSELAQGADGFLLRLTADGTDLTFSTYLGGWEDDAVHDVAVGPDGYVSATGTATLGFPTVGPQYWGYYSPAAAFLVRFSPTGSPAFVSGLAGAGTYYVPAHSHGLGVAVDGAGRTWVTGTTDSTVFPVRGSAVQAASAGGSDAFVSQFSTTGELLYSSCLGGSSGDGGYAVAVDASGRAAVTGVTASPDFPVLNPIRGFHGGTPGSTSFDGFVAKLDPAGTGLVFSTFLGEPYFAWSQAIAVDPAGSIHVGGRADLTAVMSEDTQAFLTSLSADGSSIDFTTRLGGSGFDEIRDLAVDATGDLWATGQTSSPDFPAVAAYQSLPGGGYDGFLLRFSSGPTSPAGILQLANGYGVDEQARSATVTVGRIGGQTGEVSVDYATSDGTARTPWDYSPVSGTLAFPDGATTASFSVPVFHNQVHLGDKAFSVTLANPTGGATLGRATAPVVILEADPKNTGFSARIRIRDKERLIGPAWTATVDVPWLTLSAYSGTGPSVVTATVSPEGLEPSTHYGSITVTANALGSPVVIPVTLDIRCGEVCEY